MRCPGARQSARRMLDVKKKDALEEYGVSVTCLTLGLASCEYQTESRGQEIVAPPKPSHPNSARRSDSSSRMLWVGPPLVTESDFTRHVIKESDDRSPLSRGETRGSVKALCLLPAH